MAKWHFQEGEFLKVLLKVRLQAVLEFLLEFIAQ